MKRNIQAALFDLDGVLVVTDEYHYQAWKQVADAEAIPFDRRANARLRGVGRAQCVELLLGNRAAAWSSEKKEAMAKRKNKIYRDSLKALSARDQLPGTAQTIAALRARGVRLAVASSSKNAPEILRRIELFDHFDAVCDGNCITYSKPDPEVFLTAARMLGVAPECCLVVEDAAAGIEAAHRAGMFAVGIGKYATGADRIIERIAGLIQIVDELLEEKNES